MLPNANMKPNETVEEYKWRLYNNKKEYGLSWHDIADIMNELENTHSSEDKYRKEYARCCAEWKNMYKEEDTQVSLFDFIDDSDPSTIEDVDDPMMQLKMYKYQARDEMNTANAYIRRLSREEKLMKLGEAAAHIVADKKFLNTNYTSPLPRLKNEGILQLSDWHYGIEIENHWNKYNTDVAKDRISYLLSEVIRYCKKESIGKVYVVNLSDLISGRIHSQLRIDNQIDAVTQTMQVAEILAEFIYKLSQYVEVEYHDCIDNHSRIESNKKESLQLESFVRVIHWYLNSRFENNPRITIVDNEISDDIITFTTTHGYHICGVHGDKDKPGKVIPNISGMTRDCYDLALSSHLHHFSSDEDCSCILISNGSLMGTDDYAAGLRRTSRPSQTFIVVTERSVAECIYRIVLD